MSLGLANVLSFWGNWVLLAALIIGALATGVLIVSGIVKDRAFEEYKLGVAVKVADAETVGVKAGERAGHAQAAVDSAKVEIAKANAKEAEARLETERIKENLAPRRLSEGQRSILKDEFRKMKRKIFIVGRDEDEPRQLTDQYVALLRESKMLETYVLTNSSSDRWTGIRLYLGPDVSANRFDADPLVVAFRKAGITTTGVSSGTQSGVVTNSQLQRLQPTVYVGFKPLD